MSEDHNLPSAADAIAAVGAHVEAPESHGRVRRSRSPHRNGSSGDEKPGANAELSNVLKQLVESQQAQAQQFFQMQQQQAMAMTEALAKITSMISQAPQHQAPVHSIAHTVPFLSES